jgi:hypothetical protein
MSRRNAEGTRLIAPLVLSIALTALPFVLFAWLAW